MTVNALSGRRIAIANRGEIAVRIAATCHRLGAVPIVLLGEPDLDGYAARTIGRVEALGPAGSELDIAQVVATAVRARADLLHPGYGFLSERADLADACAAAGIVFVGPSAATLRLCGDKLATRAAAERAGGPILPASPSLDDDPGEWLAAGQAVGYPLLVKPAGAGGGRGLRRVADEMGLVDAVHTSRRESDAAGAGTRVYLERELVDARHIEVQLAGDGERVLVLGDRDCSLQRRAQKVIEEAPAPHVASGVRATLHEHARRIGEEVGLRGIATCEFLLGADGTLAFLEVNPRIQVEHPVTELVTGIDLVEWQLMIAHDGLSVIDAPSTPRGHAIEARVYAEDPWAGFFPTIGRLETVSWPSRPDVRVDAGYASGDTVPTEYDAMLAKIIAFGPDRSAAIAALRVALRETVVAGVATNLPWLLNLIDTPAVAAGMATTRTAGEIPPMMPDRTPAVLAAIAHTLDHGQSASDPWSAIGPFRLSGDAALTFHGDDWEDRITLRRRTTEWEIDSGAGPVPLRWWRDAARIWTVGSGDIVARMAVVELVLGLEIVGAGGRWLVRAGTRPTVDSTRRARTSDGRVRAPMPAKVLAIHVSPGDRVTPGQPVVTLSAMKMELVCEAPGAGVVETVGCVVDELVRANAVLVGVRLDVEGADID